MIRRVLLPVFLLVLSLSISTSCRIDEVVMPISSHIVPDTADTTQQVALPCNGHPELCGKRYNQVTYPMTNNSYGYKTGAIAWAFPNQEWPIDHQLRDGVRAINLDIGDLGGTLSVFSGEAIATILTGSQALSQILNEVRQFLEGNPREVITIFMETSVGGAAIQTALNDASLTTYLHSQGPGAPWPTLEEMITAGTRLVIFTTDNDPSGPGWYHNAWDYMGSTANELGSREDFACNTTNGDIGNGLYMLNHWASTTISLLGLNLNLGIGNSDSASSLNAYSILASRTVGCQILNGHLPNFVAVDFYDTGDIFRVCNVLNNLEEF